METREVSLIKFVFSFTQHVIWCDIFSVYDIDFLKRFKYILVALQEDSYGFMPTTILAL